MRQSVTTTVPAVTPAGVRSKAMKTEKEFTFDLVCDGNTVTDETKICRCCPGECIAGPGGKEL